MARFLLKISLFLLQATFQASQCLFFFRFLLRFRFLLSIFNFSKVLLPLFLGEIELQPLQEAVFAQTSPLVVSALDGFNVCIFAYGQTGTGKTFTMEGTNENRGVNYRTLEELFRVSEERSDIMRYELFVSMLEVYNEKIRDLLVEDANQPAKKLEIKQSAEGTQEVPGLSEVPVYKTDEVWVLLKRGSRVRSVGSTNANELSSRSHWQRKQRTMRKKPKNCRIVYSPCRIELNYAFLQENIYVEVYKRRYEILKPKSRKLDRNRRNKV